MKILITGATGFVGRHLAADLLRARHEIILTNLSEGYVDVEHFGSLKVHKLDICQSDDCDGMMKACQPDAIIHLAGISQTTYGDVTKLMAINVGGTETIARSFQHYAKDSQTGQKSFLFVSSAFVYGGDKKSGQYECDEETGLSPRGDYGQSKLSAEIKVKSLANEHLAIYVVRPFNHIGVGQHSSFVVPSLVSRIKAAPMGGIIQTGSLSSVRDFTDVRDIVRAYRLIVEKKPSPRDFVLGSGKPVRVETVFDILNRLSGKNLRYEVSRDFLRNETEAVLIANPSLAELVLGWRPEISLENSLRDIWNESQKP